MCERQEGGRSFPKIKHMLFFFPSHMTVIRTKEEEEDEKVTISAFFLLLPWRR